MLLLQATLGAVRPARPPRARARVADEWEARLSEPWTAFLDDDDPAALPLGALG